MILEKALLVFILPVFLSPNGLLEEEMATHSSILAWRIESHGKRSLVGSSPWGRKESDMTERLSTNTFTISSPTSKINLLKHLISLLLPGLTDSNLAALNLPTSLNTPKMQAWSCHSPTSNFSLVVWHCPQANVPVLKLSLQGSLWLDPHLSLWIRSTLLSGHYALTLPQQVLEGSISGWNIKISTWHAQKTKGKE